MVEVSTVVDNYIRYGNGKRRNFLTVNGSSTVVNGMRPKAEQYGGFGGRGPPKNFFGVCEIVIRSSACRKYYKKKLQSEKRMATFI